MKKLLPILALVVSATAAVPVAPAAAQDGLSTRTLYQEGPGGRYLMGGQWLFRLDDANQGINQRFMRQTTTDGWTPTTVPNAWNATDESDRSMTGSVGWYRRDFRLPSASRRYDWVLRFESVNYRSRIWLNGRPIGSNRGAYLPFEVRVPASALRRGGVNRLVVRAENRRRPWDR